MLKIFPVITCASNLVQTNITYLFVKTVILFPPFINLVVTVMCRMKDCPHACQDILARFGFEPCNSRLVSAMSAIECKPSVSVDGPSAAVLIGFLEPYLLVESLKRRCLVAANDPKDGGEV